MRHLKVRIWDGKKYHYPEATKDEANHYLQFGSEGFWLFNEQGKIITATEVGGICELFIGLTDKNGKTYCENDIVLYNLKHYRLMRGTYAFWLNNFYDGSQDDPTDFFSEEAYKSGEIVGNIQENPNLIAPKDVKAQS